MPGADGGVLVAGYTKGDLDGAHAGTTRDDGFVAAVTAGGERAWTLQTGDPGAADRFYAVAPDGAGGAYVAGYTSGAVGDAPSAGDKDALVGRVSAAGELLWLRQVGGPGEDKALAVAASPDGAVYVGGVSGGGMPGAERVGANDGWVARYGADGEQEWLRAAATGENDQVNGLVARSDGSVVAVGHTRGALGEDGNLGDNDVVVRALDATGEVLWTTQVGTSTDDRGVTGVLARRRRGARRRHDVRRAGHGRRRGRRRDVPRRGRRHPGRGDADRVARARRRRRVGRREPVRGPRTRRGRPRRRRAAHRAHVRRPRGHDERGRRRRVRRPDPVGAVVPDSGAAAPALDVTAEARCLAGKAYVAVRATSTGVAPCRRRARDAVRHARRPGRRAGRVGLPVVRRPRHDRPRGRGDRDGGRPRRRRPVRRAHLPLTAPRRLAAPRTTLHAAEHDVAVVISLMTTATSCSARGSLLDSAVSR
nr:SBBP repeat-containing protein [Cellulosimicrobium sp. MM]